MPKEILIYEVRWVNLKDIILNKRDQTQQMTCESSSMKLLLAINIGHISEQVTSNIGHISAYFWRGGADFSWEEE